MLKGIPSVADRVEQSFFRDHLAGGKYLCRRRVLLRGHRHRCVEIEMTRVVNECSEAQP